jgi:[citrate (pro-3S)-lyase] ligase
MNYRIANFLSENEMNQCKLLLQQNNLRFEDKITDTIAIYDQDKIIATGSIYMNVIKMIAVDEEYQGENITGIILNYYISYFTNQGINKYFIFTKPESKKYFLDYHFSLVAETNSVAMLENNFNTVRSLLYEIKNKYNLPIQTRACIVMNCNPVTMGHIYLVEKCAKENERVIIFLVEEDKSIFPFQTRLRLLSAAISHLTNVTIIPSTQYIISSATFPTYFMKELNDASYEYMKLDINIFKEYFMDIFQIEKRYVGSEPLDVTTSAYNQTMKEILGDQLIVVDRKMFDSHIISASLVRKLAKEGKFDELKPYVPAVTFDFLISDEGKSLFYER